MWFFSKGSEVKMFEFTYNDEKAILITSEDILDYHGQPWREKSSVFVKRLSTLRGEGIKHIFVISSVPFNWFPKELRDLVKKDLGRTIYYRYLR